MKNRITISKCNWQSLTVVGWGALYKELSTLGHLEICIAYWHTQDLVECAKYQLMISPSNWQLTVAMLQFIQVILF